MFDRLDPEKIWGPLRGNCTLNQKLTCFALYLEIVNTFVQNNVYILIVQGT